MTSKSQKPTKKSRKPAKRSSGFPTLVKLLILLLIGVLAGLAIAALNSGAMSPYRNQPALTPIEPEVDEEVNVFVVPNSRPVEHDEEEDDSASQVAPDESHHDSEDSVRNDRAEDESNDDEKHIRQASPIDRLLIPGRPAPTAPSQDVQNKAPQTKLAAEPSRNTPAKRMPDRLPARMSDRMERAFPSSPQNDSAANAANNAANVAKDVLAAEKLR